MRRYFTPGASGRFSTSGASSSPGPVGRAGPAVRVISGAAGVGPLVLPLLLMVAIVVAASGRVLRLARLLLDLADEIVGALFQTLADLEAHEAPDADVLAGLGHQIGLQRADVLLAL